MSSSTTLKSPGSVRLPGQQRSTPATRNFRIREFLSLHLTNSIPVIFRSCYHQNSFRQTVYATGKPGSEKRHTRSGSCQSASSLLPHSFRQLPHPFGELPHAIQSYPRCEPGIVRSFQGIDRPLPACVRVNTPYCHTLSGNRQGPSGSCQRLSNPCQGAYLLPPPLFWFSPEAIPTAATPGPMVARVVSTTATPFPTRVSVVPTAATLFPGTATPGVTAATSFPAHVSFNLYKIVSKLYIRKDLCFTKNFNYDYKK